MKVIMHAGIHKTLGWHDHYCAACYFIRKLFMHWRKLFFWCLEMSPCELLDFELLWQEEEWWKVSAAH
jgi:hypothetical protein